MSIGQRSFSLIQVLLLQILSICHVRLFPEDVCESLGLAPFLFVIIFWLINYSRNAGKTSILKPETLKGGSAHSKTFVFYQVIFSHLNFFLRTKNAPWDFKSNKQNTYCFSNEGFPKGGTLFFWDHFSLLT